MVIFLAWGSSCSGLQKNVDQNWELARDILLESIEQNSENGHAIYNLALLYNEMNKKDSALFYFDACLKYINYNPRIYYNYGLLLDEMGNEKKAEKIFISGIDLDPNDVELNYALTVFYFNKKEFAKAKPFIDRLIIIQPENDDIKKLHQAINSLN